MSEVATVTIKYTESEVALLINSLEMTTSAKVPCVENGQWKTPYEKLKDENGYVFPDELVRNCGTYGVFKDEGEIKRILESMRLECKLTEKNKMYKISWSI